MTSVSATCGTLLPQTGILASISSEARTRTVAMLEILLKHLMSPSWRSLSKRRIRKKRNAKRQRKIEKKEAEKKRP